MTDTQNHGSDLRKTALYDEHVKAGGKMVSFGGWNLPIQYTGVIDEHLACRSAAGLFDVSHMGEFLVEGSKATAYLDFLLPNHVAKLEIGQALYSPLCHPTGGIVDDLLVYRRADDKYLVVVNAANTAKDFAHFKNVLDGFAGRQSVHLKDASGEYSQIALQGRGAIHILSSLTNVELDKITYYHFAEGTVLGSVSAVIARTGYTGEDGFELYVPWNKGPEVWQALLQEGKAHGLKPCGLGARDTLRLEMKFPLYGQELTDSTHPIEAGLGWTVKLDKGDFIGRGPIATAKEKGSSRKLVGLALKDRNIPRAGYKVFSADGQTETGLVTSGTLSPSLQAPIAIAWVKSGDAAVGTPLSVEIRGQKFTAEVVKTPFYKRPY